MHDFLTEEIPPLDEEQPSDADPAFPSPFGPTGPRTPHGKATSSMNGLKHGCRSEKTILPGEDPAEFEFTIKGWFTHYDPQDGVAYTLVEETARAHWFLKRNEKWLEKVQWDLPSEPSSWTDSDHKRFTNFSRYKTTAERAFFRHYKELEAYYGRLDRAEQLRSRARDRLIRLQIQWCNEKQKTMAEELKLQQVIEVEVVNGQTRTFFFPSNQQMMKEAAKRPQVPLLFERYISFPQGVPPEYDWTRLDEFRKRTDMIGVQKMSYDTWLEVIQREAASGSGHVGPVVPIDSDPEPESRPPA